MKKSKKIFLIISIIVITLITLFTTYSLGQYVGKSNIDIKEPVYVENVKSAPRIVEYSPYVTYDPLTRDVPNLGYSTSSYSDYVSYYYYDVDTGLEISVAQKGYGASWDNEYQFSINSFSLFVVVHAYNANEGSDVYYYARDISNTFAIKFDNSFNFAKLDQSENQVHFTRFGFSGGIVNEYDYQLSFSYYSYFLTDNSPNDLTNFSYSYEEYDVLSLNMFLEEPEIPDITIQRTMENPLFNISYYSYKFGMQKGYADGKVFGESLATNNGYLGGIFDLFERSANVFTSVMNVSIFPNITLGTLILFPLIILLISIIIKLFFGG